MYDVRCMMYDVERHPDDRRDLMWEDGSWCISPVFSLVLLFLTNKFRREKKEDNDTGIRTMMRHLLRRSVQR